MLAQNLLQLGQGHPGNSSRGKERGEWSVHALLPREIVTSVHDFAQRRDHGVLLHQPVLIAHCDMRCNDTFEVFLLELTECELLLIVWTGEDAPTLVVVLKITGTIILTVT